MPATRRPPTLAGIYRLFRSGRSSVFWLLAAMAVASILATLAIPADAIDHQMARGLGDLDETHDPRCRRQAIRLSGAADLQAAADICRRARCCFISPTRRCCRWSARSCALVNSELGTTLMSVCIIAAQMVMVPVAMLVGRKADVWGRKPIFAARAGRAGAARRAVSALRQSLLAGRRADPRRRRRRNSSARCFRWSSPTSRAAPATSISARARSRPQRAWAARSAPRLPASIVVRAGYSAAFLALAALAGIGLILFIVRHAGDATFRRTSSAVSTKCLRMVLHCGSSRR